jgi:hypothetical protein
VILRAGLYLGRDVFLWVWGTDPPLDDQNRSSKRRMSRV